jgi:hypothetical protein
LLQPAKILKLALELRVAKVLRRRFLQLPEFVF